MIGVQKVDISLKDQLVTVDTVLPFDRIEAAIKKTGKTVKSGRVVVPEEDKKVENGTVKKVAVVA